MIVAGLENMKGVKIPKASRIGIVVPDIGKAETARLKETVPYEEAMERIGGWVKEVYSKQETAPQQQAHTTL